jgi:hypothetical protein
MGLSFAAAPLVRPSARSALTRKFRMIINAREICDAALLPTIVCSWCKQVLRIGTPKISHGICAPCATLFFGRAVPLPVALPV